MIVKILLLLFVIRPLIDLAWRQNLFFGLNLAGVIAVVIIALSFCYLILHLKKRIEFSVFSGIIFIFYIFAITLLNGSSLSDFNYFLRLLSEFSFFAIVAPNISLNKLSKVMAWFVIATMVPIVLTYLQVAGVVKYTYFDYVQGNMISRGSGGYRQPSVLTRFCSIGLLYALYLIENLPKGDKRRLYLWFYIPLNLIAVFFSYHRTGYFLILFNAGLWFFLKDMKRALHLLFRVGLVCVCLLAVFLVIYKLNLIAVDLSTFKKMLSFSNIATRNPDGSINLILRGRGKILQLLFEGFSTNPIKYTILGNGVNENPVTHIAIAIADMELIRVLWNGGIIGAILWLIHFGSMKMKISQRRKDVSVNSFYRLATVMFWCFIVWGFCIEATESPDLMYHVYLICGWLCFKNNVRENQRALIWK